MRVSYGMAAFAPDDTAHSVVTRLTPEATGDPRHGSLVIEGLVKTLGSEAFSDALCEEPDRVNDAIEAIGGLFASHHAGLPVGDVHYAVATDEAILGSAMSLGTAIAKGDRIGMRIGAVDVGLDVVGYFAHATPFGAQAKVVVTILKVAAPAFVALTQSRRPRAAERFEGDVLRSYAQHISPETLTLAPLRLRSIGIPIASPAAAIAIDWNAPGREHLAAALAEIARKNTPPAS